MEQKRPLLALLLSVGILLTAPAVRADLLWREDWVSYTYSNRFTEPGVDEYVAKHIVEFVHVNGYSLGNNLMRGKVLLSDENDPSTSGGGATEFYMVYRHLLSFGRVSGRSFAFGPVRDVGLTAGFDVNTKNNAFSPSKLLLVLGPTLTFDVPRGALLNFSVLAAKEYNRCALPPCLAPGAQSEIAFDTFPLLHSAFRFPLRVGSVGTRIEGFAAKGFRRGTDYVGKEVAHETLVRVAWLADVGALVADRPDALFAGIGYEYWRNKYGASGVPGVDTNAPTLQLKWHF